MQWHLDSVLTADESPNPYTMAQAASETPPFSRFVFTITTRPAVNPGCLPLRDEGVAHVRLPIGADTGGGRVLGPIP